MEGQRWQHRMDILCVRKYRHDLRQHQVGWAAKRLYRIEFHPLADPEGYRFVDPDQVIQAAYIIPAYVDGKAVEEEASIANVKSLGKGAQRASFYVIL